MKYLLSFILLISSLSLIAQVSNRKIEWGKRLKSKGFNYKFLDLSGDTYQFVFKSNKKNRLITHSLNHKIISDEDFDYVYNKQRLKIHGSIRTKSSSFVYMHQYNKKYKKWVLHVSEYKNKTYTEPKEVYFQEIDFDKSSLRKAFKYYDSQSRTRAFTSGSDGGLIISADSTKVAFINHLKAPRDGEQEGFAIAVFDEKMDLIWKDVFYHNYGDEGGYVKQKLVSNDGEVYILAKVYQKILSGKVKSKKSKYLSNFRYNIAHINQEGILDHTIDLGNDIAAVGMRMFFPNDSKKQYLLSGFYTNDEFGSNLINGVFFSYGDKNFEKSEVKVHEFDKDFLDNLTTNRSIKIGKGITKNYEIKDMLEYRDGTLGFIAEESFTTLWGPLDDQERIYHTNNIIIPKFDSEGNLLNIQKIEKECKSKETATISYSLAINKGKAYLVFNDFKERKEKKALKKKGRVFTDLVIIDEDGEIETRETLFSNKDIDLYFNTTLTGYNNDIMLIGTSLQRFYQMATLKFD